MKPRFVWMNERRNKVSWTSFKSHSPVCWFRELIFKSHALLHVVYSLRFPIFIKGPTPLCDYRFYHVNSHKGIPVLNFKKISKIQKQIENGAMAWNPESVFHFRPRGRPFLQSYTCTAKCKLTLQRVAEIDNKLLDHKYPSKCQRLFSSKHFCKLNFNSESIKCVNERMK